MSEDEKIILTPEQTKAMLPDRNEIHTFLNPSGGLLLGADWPREDVLREIDRCTCELGGPQCRAVKHDLVIHLPQIGPLFVETVDQTPQ